MKIDRIGLILTTNELNPSLIEKIIVRTNSDTPFKSYFSYQQTDMFNPRNIGYFGKLK